MAWSERQKRYDYQRETTGSSSDSLQLCPFLLMVTSLKGKNLLPEVANSFHNEKFLMEWKITFTTLGDLP